jgi:hypothetical protein
MKSLLIRRYFYFILASLTYLVVHEGMHILQALMWGVYKGIRILPLGIEVEIIQPLTIGGFKLAAFSGLSSVVTVSTGYLLLLFSSQMVKLKSQPLKNYVYYVTLVFLLLDPVYISLLSFVVGGDINGIVMGLGINYFTVRSIYFVIAVINAFLVYKKLYPAYVKN